MWNIFTRKKNNLVPSGVIKDGKSASNTSMMFPLQATFIRGMAHRHELPRLIPLAPGKHLLKQEIWQGEIRKKRVVWFKENDHTDHT